MSHNEEMADVFAKLAHVVKGIEADNEAAEKQANDINWEDPRLQNAALGAGIGAVGGGAGNYLLNRFLLGDKETPWWKHVGLGAAVGGVGGGGLGYALTDPAKTGAKPYSYENEDGQEMYTTPDDVMNHQKRLKEHQQNLTAARDNLRAQSKARIDLASTALGGPRVSWIADLPGIKGMTDVGTDIGMSVALDKYKNNPQFQEHIVRLVANQGNNE